jgi:hypothetical protein
LIETQAIKQKCMASSAVPFENTIGKQWLPGSGALEPCSTRRAGGIPLARRNHWLTLHLCSARNRKPGAVSRPGAILEFQFRKYTDLPAGVNNSEDRVGQNSGSSPRSRAARRQGAAGST